MMLMLIRAQASRQPARLLLQPLLWVILALTLLGAVAAYQVRHTYTVDVGSDADSFYLRNFHARSADTVDGRPYRQADAYGYVVLPGIGGGVPYTVTLDLHPGQANTPVTIIVNGETFQQGTLPDRWQEYTVAVDATHPAALASRDLVVEIRAPQGQGILLDRVEVGAFAPGFVAPAYAQLAYLLASVLLVYLLVARLIFLFRPTASVQAASNPTTSPPRLRVSAMNRKFAAPLLAAALTGALLVALLATMHLPLTAVTSYLVVGLLGAQVLLWVAPPLPRWLVPEARTAGRLLMRPLPWIVAAMAVLGAVAAFQVRHAYDIDIGSPADQAYTDNFHDRDLESASGRTFRAGGVYSYVNLLGVGGGVPYSLTLTLRMAHPNLPLTVIVNGETVLQRSLPNQWQTYTFAIDASHPRALASRDLVLELRTPESYNLLLDRVQVSEAGPGFVVPAVSQLAYLAAVVLLAYLLLGRALLGVPRARMVPVAGAVLAGGVLVALLAAVHLPLTVALPHLVTTGVLTYAVLLLAEWAARRITPAAPGGARAVAALVAGAFLVRYGLMALPESIIIDMPYHLRWIRELLIGNVGALTDPHGGLNQPPREWNLAIIIPKSPLFYFLAYPLALIPGTSLEPTVDVFICLMEASTVLFCYGLLARFAPRLGGWRAGLWAAAVYAVTPLSFRALAYGILPTILAQWLALVFFTLLLVWVQAAGSGQPAVGSRQPAGLPIQRSTQHATRNMRLRQALLLLAILVVLTAALIAFPTIAVFTTLVAGGVALVWMRARYRRLGWMVGGVLAVAWVGAIGLYYGVYLVELVTKSLPELLGAQAAAAAGRGAAPPAPSTVHWTGPLDVVGWTFSYLVSLLPLLLGLAGLAILWIGAFRARRTKGTIASERLLAVLTGFWMLILPIFMVVNYRFDMIGKHLYYTMVPLALGSGIALWLLSRRGGVARLWAATFVVALAGIALAFWIERLVSVSS